MLQTVCVACADSPVGQKLIADFQDRGLTVYAGYARGNPGGDRCFACDPLDLPSLQDAAKAISVPLDLLVVIPDGPAPNDKTPDGFTDTAAALEDYRRRAVGPLRILNAFLPLLEQGQGKRVGIVTSALSSINLCSDGERLAERMSLAALNMAASQLFNLLRPKGYTFRMYCRAPEGQSDAWASDYFTRARSYEAHDLKHSDEERLVLRDWQAREIPW